MSPMKVGWSFVNIRNFYVFFRNRRVWEKDRATFDKQSGKNTNRNIRYLWLHIILSIISDRYKTEVCHTGRIFSGTYIVNILIFFLYIDTFESLSSDEDDYLK